MDKLTLYFLIFIIYAFLGYLCEVIYVFLITKKITNRGYLYGPLVPIYAFGALLIIIPLNEFEFGTFITDRWYLVLLIGLLVPTLLEYLTSYVMEKIFKMRWWDYSDKFLNINGRVCLRNSLMFMALVVIVVYGLNPPFTKLVGYIVDIDVLNYILCSCLFIAFIVDIILSTIHHVNISKIIIKLEELKEKAIEYKDDKMEALSEKIDNAKIKTSNYLADIKDKLNRVSIHYPSLKVIINKKRISFKEYLNKFKKDKEEE